jgi:uncharacterized protein (TIGR02646 family)
MSAEPASLTAHRKTAHCNYGNYADMDGLRRALVTDQRGLCCYCMARIHGKRDEMKIEHWQCQDRYPAEQLDYSSLLGACMGCQGEPPALQHCDTYKGDRDLKWNPADPAHHIETRVRYEIDGSIRSDDAVFETVVKHCLLGNGNVTIDRDDSEGARPDSPSVIPGFIRATRPKQWVKSSRAETERTIVVLDTRKASLLAAAVAGKIGVGVAA